MFSFLPLLALTLNACTHADFPPAPMRDPGSPYSLLDASSEVVTVDLQSNVSVSEVQNWVESDQPTRAELYCDQGDTLCDAAEEALSLYGVEYEWIPAKRSRVHLIYERVIARDCENHYVSIPFNPFHQNHPAFGCSTASNMVKMVTDRREFINPALLGFYDGRKAVHNVERYLKFDSTEYFDEELGVNSISFQSN